MKSKAISFTPEVLKAKLRALAAYGTFQTRRPVRPAPPSVDLVRGMSGSDFSIFTDWRTPGIFRVGGPVWAVRDLMGVEPEWRPPFGLSGQRLWARERARVLEYDGHGRGRVRLRYEVDGVESDWIVVPERIVTCEPGTCIANGVFREGARHFLEVVEVRAELVSGISEADALLEGVAPVVHEHWTAYDPETDGYPSFGVEPDAEMISIRRLESVRHHGPNVIATAGSRFHTLYDSIYGAGAHATDWCWVYTLKRAAP